MQNKFLGLALAVIVGVSVGVILLSKQPGSKMDSLTQQQAETVRILKSIEAGMASKGGQELSSVMNTLQDLQRRVAALEAKAVAAPPARDFPPQPPQEDFSKQHDIPVEHSYVRGPKNAPITITEFVDFQCPFCARFHQPILDVLKAYPDKVNYVLKNFPLSFHPQAKPASKAAFAAGEQGKYWEMVDGILKNNSGLSDEKFAQIAEEIGLNVDKFKKDLAQNDAKYEGWINEDMALGGEVDVRGTPTFYLNGRKTMARDLNGFKQEVDKLLQE